MRTALSLLVAVAALSPAPADAYRIKYASGYARLSAVHRSGDLAEASYDLNIRVRGHYAEISTTQTVVNRAPTGAAEAMYSFELPREAVVSGLDIDLADGTKATGSIVGASGAIRHVPGDPSNTARPDVGLLRLVHSDDERNRYELRVYPVAAGSSVTWTVHWLAPMIHHDRRLAVRIPGRGDADNLTIGRAVVRLSPLAGTGGFARLVAGGEVRTRSAKGEYRFALPARGDLTVEATPTYLNSTVPRLDVATARLGKALGVVAMTLTAPTVLPNHIRQFDRLLLVVDVSRSMGRGGFDAARETVSALLGGAEERTEVEAILFHRTPQRVHGKFVANTASMRRSLLEKIDWKLQTNGSDLAGAMAMADDIIRKSIPRSANPSASPKKDTLVVVISDGMSPLAVTGQRTIDQMSSQALEAARVVSITLVPPGAPAPDPGQVAVTTLAHATGGRSLALRLDEVAPRAKTLWAELGQPPPLESITLEDDFRLKGVLLPAKLSSGSSAFAVGLYLGDAPKKLTVTASSEGRDIAIVSRRSKALGNAAIPLSLGQGISTAELSLESREALRAAAVKHKVVDEQHSLVAVHKHDRFARERLAMANRWGLDQYRRVGPSFEKETSFAPFVLSSMPASTTPLALRQRHRPTGQLDASIVQRLVRTYVVPKVRHCYELAIRGNHSLSGTLTLVIEFARGEVQYATVRGALSGPQAVPGSVEQCVEDAAYSIDVPRVAVGSDAEVVGVARYPLSFRVVDHKGQVRGGRLRPDDAFDSADPLDGL